MKFIQNRMANSNKIHILLSRKILVSTVQMVIPKYTKNIYLYITPGAPPDIIVFVFQICLKRGFPKYLGL